MSITAQQFGSVGDSSVYDDFSSLCRLSRDHGSDVGICKCGVTHLQRFCAFNETRLERVINGRLDQDALGTDTILTRCPKRTRDARLYRIIKRAVIQDDDRGVAASIHR